MARIRPYESQVSPRADIPASDATLSDVGGPGVENLGQSIVQAGYSGAHAYQILQAQEDANATTKVHVALAEMANRATQTLQQAKATADPADPDFFGTVYRGGTPEGEDPAEGSINDQLNKLDEQVTNPIAKRAFQEGANHLRSQVLNQAVAFQGHLAGVYAKQQAIQLTDQLQAMTQTDPSQHENALALMNAAVNDPKGIFYRPGMDAGVREAIKRDATAQISSGTVRGMIGDAPYHALHSLETGEWDNKITGEQKVVLMNDAQTKITSLEVDARRAEAEQRRQLKETYDATGRTLTSQFLMHEDSPTNPMTPPLTATAVAQQLMANKLDDNTGRALFGLIDSNSKEKALKNDEDVSASLLRRIYLPYGNPNKITDEIPLIKAATNKQITTTRMKFLRDEFEKARTDEGMTLGKSRDTFLATRKSSITQSNPLLGKMDQEGDINFGRLSEYAASEESRLRKANKNPHDLYNENSPEYLGKQLSNFQKPLSQSIRDIGEKYKQAPGLPKTPQAGVPDSLKRLPGETIEQYNKRTGR